MTQSHQEPSQRSVICLFCGQAIALSESESRRARSLADGAFPGCLLRCRSCSKEALYMASEIIDFQTA